MKISKYGWLAGLLALAAVVGAVGFNARTVNAATVTGAVKTCATPANVGTCTLTVTVTAGTLFSGDQIVVTATGPATFTGPVTVTTSSGTCTGAISGQTATGFTATLTGAGCGAVGTITFTEPVAVTGTGAFSQTAANPFSGTSAVGTAAVTFVPAVPTGVTKACTTAAVPGQPAGTAVVGQPITCTATVTFPVAPTAPTPGTITVTNGTLTAPAGGTFTCPAGATTCTVTETIVPTTAGTVPTQAITISGTTFTPALGGITSVISAAAAAPAPVVLNVAGCQAVPIPTTFAGAVAFFTGTFTTTFTVNAGAAPLTVTCLVDIDELTADPEFVSSGIVNVTVGGLNAGSNVSSVIGVAAPAFALVSSGTVTGATANVRCGPFNTDESCDFVLVQVTVAPSTAVALPNTQTITITAHYVPDNPLLNTPGTLPATTAFTLITQQVVAPAAVGVLTLACVTPPGVSLTNPFPAPLTPGQLPGTGVGTALAVGVLPGGVSCEAFFVDPATGLRVQVAPGTIEVSSLSGSLINLSGTLATNLRIPCGSNLVAFPSTVGAVVNINNCAGVRFSVLGQGVGIVEIRARYEPAPNFGQPEQEASGFVTFVAPAVGLSLTLNPDPVAVGATGTATAFLNQLFVPNCGAVACVDPATGLPINVAANPGSILNGIVVFTIADTAIARFNEGASIIANAGTTLNTGVFSTANQVAKACGAFSGGSTAVFQNIGGASGVLAPYFGGCTQASTTYLGVNPGATQIAASFIPFLPGATSLTSAITGTSSGFALGAGIQAFNFFAPAIGPANTFRVLQVAGAAPATTIRLVPGCNNVVAPATETVAQVVARVDPSSTVYSVFKQIPGTTQFQGAPGPASGNVPAGVANLSGVNALDAIFICVNAAATYRIV